MKRLLGPLLALGCLGTARDAGAFCGFYVSGGDAKLFNNATQVVLMRQGTRTVLSMQNNYQGPPENFALVVPVPVVLHKENVKTLARGLFDRVDQLSAPRLVEYWEQDPCPEWSGESLDKSARAAPASMPGNRYAVAGGKVVVEAEFTVGEYEVVVLSAGDSTALDTWLRDNHYRIPEGAEPYLRPYVQGGSKFFVARVNAARVTFDKGMATLSPLRFHYDSEAFNLPVRLGLLNSAGTQDLIVHILSPTKRYEAANYPNATVPTNVDVAEAARDQFGSFYAALFDRTVEQTPHAVVTEYAWASSSCDPCPVEALSAGELASLGADVLDAGPEGDAAPGARAARGRDFVLTRLHARYARGELGEDLVFREASPLEGGREYDPPGPERQKARVASAGSNNFQARYAIRHPWQGDITCPEPRFGQWGGDPNPKAAQNLAFAPRGASLSDLLAADVPSLGLHGTPIRAPARRFLPLLGALRSARGALLLGLVLGLAAIAVLRFREGRTAS